MRTEEEIKETIELLDMRIKHEAIIGAAITCDESCAMRNTLKWVLEKEKPINSGYPLLGEVRADVQELLQMIAEIPCTCDKIYTDRKLRAPDCPRCNWVEDDIVKKVNEHFA